MQIEQIVDVQIQLGAQTVNTPGFGVALFLSVVNSWNDRVRVYDSYDSAAADLTDPGDAVLLSACALYFEQQFKPISLVIGRIENSETLAQALAAVQLVNDNWYAIVAFDHTQAHVVALAGVVEAMKKIFITSSADAAIGTSGTSDVAYALNALGYKRTAVLYSASAAQFPEAAWLGACLPLGVGNSTWKFKELVGIASDNLSPTFISFAKGKKANMYVPVQGVNITIEGTMVGGQFIDLTRGVDALQATMEVDVLQLFVDQPKVPYTNDGISQIENIMRQDLAQFVANGFLSGNPKPSVSGPDANSVPQSDKRNRVLNGLAFSATVAGAIHKTTINGFLSF
jgi:hypothetical protein